jgi:hypothetical protein
MKCFLLEIGFPSSESLRFDIRNLTFSLSLFTFSMCISFLKEFLP